MISRYQEFIVTDAPDALNNTVKDYWSRLLVVQSLSLVGVIAAPNVLLGGQPRLHADETLFAYSGWLWAETEYSPYLHLWDIKPPAIHELAAVFSLVTGGSPYGIAVLSVGSMIAAVVASTYLLGEITHQYTDNEYAAYAAGTTPLVFPKYYVLAGTGLRPKHFTILFGLLSVYLVLSSHWGSAGFSGALAAGFWQLGIVFPVVVVLMAWQRSGERLERAVAGSTAAFVVVVTPVLASGFDVFESMLVEVVGTPLLVVEPFELGVRLRKFVDFTDTALPVFGLGITGAAAALLYDRGWWVTVGTGWFLLQIFRLDLDYPPDLVVLLVFVSLGVGFLVDVTDEWVVAVLLLLGVVAVGVGVAGPSLIVFPVEEGTAPTTVDALFWNSEPPEHCHVRRSPPERQFAELLHEGLDTGECRYSVRQLLR